MKKQKMKKIIRKLKKRLEVESQCAVDYFSDYLQQLTVIARLERNVGKLTKENRQRLQHIWDLQAELDNRPTMAGFYTREEMDRSARAILSQDTASTCFLQSKD